jgi:hypothetical protein
MIHRPPTGADSAYIQRSQDEQQGFGRIFGWWYRYTAPPVSSVGATFEQREKVRRGRLASTIMLALGFILIVLVGPIGI